MKKAKKTRKQTATRASTCTRVLAILGAVKARNGHRDERAPIVTLAAMTFAEIRAMGAGNANVLCQTHRPKISRLGGLAHMRRRLEVAKTDRDRICPKCGEVAAVKKSEKIGSSIRRTYRCANCTLRYPRVRPANGG